MTAITVRKPWFEMNRHERLDAAIGLTEKGLSCREVANELGTTIGSIAGLWRRYPLRFKRVSGGDWNVAQLSATAKQSAAIRDVPITLATINVATETAEDIPDMTVETRPDDAERRTIVSVRDGECRWMTVKDVRGVPIEQLFVCGEPVDPAGGSWCPEHRKRVMAPADVRRLPMKQLLRGVRL